LAHERGLIRSIDDTVREYVPPVQLYNPIAPGNKADRFAAADLLTPFETAHNRTITWNHLLRQVSDWEGTLWGKPDLGGPSRAERRAMAHAPAQSAGQRLQIQRRARQRAGARGAERMAAAAAASAQGNHHGSDRRQHHLALVRL
jgi:hypothetical protein